MSPFQKTKSSDTLPGESESLSQAVIEAVAAADGCDTTALPTLFDRLDPDALDNLFGARGRSDGSEPLSSRVCFTYHDYEVHAYADGRVTVDPL